MPDPRLAFLTPGYPFAVRYRINKKNSLITLVIKTPGGLARHVLSVLDLLAGLGHQLKRQEGAGARDLRTDQELRLWEQKKEKVRAAYRKLRLLNVAHLAAVRAVCDQSAFYNLKAYGWTFSDFHACIGPASLYHPSVPVLDRKVRALPLKRRSRFVVGAVGTGRATS